jgi:hypothetical protein
MYVRRDDRMLEAPVRDDTRAIEWHVLVWTARGVSPLAVQTRPANSASIARAR